MTYLDSSVAVAQLAGEDRRPPVEIWGETLVSSRLLEYEVHSALHRLGLAATHMEAARLLLGRVALIEMVSDVLARALSRFPAPVRALDALHLASIEFLRENRQRVKLASYDERLLAAARSLGLELYDLS